MRAFVSSVLFAAVLIAVVAWHTHRTHPPTPGEQLLDYVPHDTAFLLGATHGVAPGERLSAWQSLLRPLALRATFLDPGRMATEKGPAPGVVAAVARQLAAAAVEGSAWPLGIIGLPHSGVFAAYTVDGVPVLRWELENPRALQSTLETAERLSGTSGRTATRGDLRLWRYAFGDTESAHPELVVARGDDFALATLDSPGMDREALDAVLGITRPGTAFDPNRLDTMAAAHGLIPGTVGIIDNQRLLDALSGPLGRQLGGLVRGLSGASAATDSMLDSLRGSDCREEITAMADFWPRTALGIPATAEPGQPVGLRLVGVVSNQDSLAALERLRGQVPESVWTSRGILSLGLGLDPVALPRLLAGLETRMTGTPHPCRAFAGIQSRLAGVAARGRGMFDDSSVPEEKADIHGMAAVLVGMRPPGEAPWWTGGEGVLTLTTDEPETAWRMLQPMLGIGAEAVAAELNGESAGLSRYAIPRSNVRVMLGEDELSFLLGDAELHALENAVPEPPARDSLLVLRYRHERLSHAIDLVAEHLLEPADSARRETLAVMARRMRDTGIDVELSADVVEAGVNLDITAHAPR